MMNRTLAISACFGLCVFVGCGEEKGPKTVPAEGTITLDGKPLEGAAIAFVTISGESAQAISDAEGKFSLNAFEYKTGAQPGTYMTVITKTVEILDTGPKPPANSEAAKHAAEEAAEGGGGAQMGVKNVLPQKYQTPTEDFSFVVPEEGTTELLIELKSK